MREDVDHALSRFAEVDRHDDRAEAERGKIGHMPFGTVRRKNRYAIALRNTHFCELLRKSGDTPQQLRRRDRQPFPSLFVQLRACRGILLDRLKQASWQRRIIGHRPELYSSGIIAATAPHFGQNRSARSRAPAIACVKMGCRFMPDSRTQSTAAKPIRAPRGAALFCQGWQQEAALRLLMNSLDPAVAENPEDLEVSAGVGKLARDWPAFDAIVNSLTKLSGDETLLIRSGVPAPILKTTPNAPRVLVVNSSVPSPAPLLAADEALQPRAARFAADWTFTGPSTALPEAFAVFRAAARKHFGGTLAGRLVVSGGMGGLGGAQGLAASLNEAAFLGIDADANRIKRRLKTGYCEVMVNSLDEALRILKNAVRKREPASVGLIANAAELIPELARRGILPDLLTDQTPASDLLAYIPQGLTIAQAADLRGRDPQGYRERSLDSVAAQARGLVELKKMGSLVFEFGNGI